MESKILNLENDIINEKEGRNIIKEIHDVCNREYMDIVNKKKQNIDIIIFYL